MEGKVAFLGGPSACHSFFFKKKWLWGASLPHDTPFLTRSLSLTGETEDFIADNLFENTFYTLNTFYIENTLYLDMWSPVFHRMCSL